MLLLHLIQLEAAAACACAQPRNSHAECMSCNVLGREVEKNGLNPQFAEQLQNMNFSEVVLNMLFAAIGSYSCDDLVAVASLLPGAGLRPGTGQGSCAQRFRI